MKNSNRQIKPPRLAKLLLFGWLTTVILLPFHGFISTWLGTVVGPLSLWKGWKDLLIIALVLIATALIIYQKPLRQKLAHRLINRVILIYTLWQVIITIFSSADLDARLLGLAINLRFLAFFIITQITVFYFATFLQKRYKRLLLAPFAIVVFFGIMQLFVLPKDFLAHFGYDKNTTIAPYLTIDSQPDTLRIASFQRGPNQLGSYLVLPMLVLFTTIFYRHKKWLKEASQKNTFIVAVLLAISSLIVLYGAHSRSAFLAIITAASIWLLSTIPAKWRARLVVFGLIGSLIAVGLTIQFRHTDFVQTVILHDKQDYGPADTSNSVRTSAYESAVGDIQERPLSGCGSGCAGPASFYNEKEDARLAENYYLQVAQEGGLIGLAFFVAIIVLLARRLYQQKDYYLSKILLASLVGLSIANLFLHIWADETVAIIWWGFAGLLFLEESSV